MRTKATSNWRGNCSFASRSASACHSPGRRSSTRSLPDRSGNYRSRQDSPGGSEFRRRALRGRRAVRSMRSGRTTCRATTSQRKRRDLHKSQARKEYQDGLSSTRPSTPSAGSVTASEIYMRQSEPPCSRKSAVPEGIFGSLASSNGAQPIVRAEV
jgi:hypothetical protein